MNYNKIEKDIDILTKLDEISIDPKKLNQIYKLNLHNKFLLMKSEKPNLTQHQICKALGTSESTMKRIRKDLDIQSPYRFNIPLKKSTTSSSEKIECDKCNTICKNEIGLKIHRISCDKKFQIDTSKSIKNNKIKLKGNSKVKLAGNFSTGEELINNAFKNE